MNSSRRTRRKAKTAIVCSILAFLFIILATRRHGLASDHHITPTLLNSDLTFTTEDKKLLATAQARAICSEHGFRPYAKTRKVYDLVLFSSELDWLEIRLHTLAPYVDYFVVVESPTTFTGKPKPLVLKENWSRFESFHDKIIYKAVEDPVSSTRIWDHEDYLRDSLLKEVFPTLVGTDKEAEKNDVLLVSDIDEIVRPGAMLLLRHCDFPARLTLRTQFYYYSFQWRHRGEQWAHPQATSYGGTVANTVAPNDLRNDLLGPGLLPVAALSRWWNRATLWNAGWHCSSCFATIAEMQMKMNSFSHQGWNTPENRDAKAIINRVRNGLDLFDREGELYDKLENNNDVPRYIIEQSRNKGRYKYLLDRDGKNAGFEDWQTALSGS